MMQPSNLLFNGYTNNKILILSYIGTFISFFWGFISFILLCIYSKKQIDDEIYVYTSNFGKTIEYKTGLITVIFTFVNVISLIATSIFLSRISARTKSQLVLVLFAHSLPFMFGMISMSLNCEYANCFNVVTPLYIMIWIYIMFIGIIVLTIILVKLGMYMKTEWDNRNYRHFTQNNNHAMLV